MNRAVPIAAVVAAIAAASLVLFFTADRGEDPPYDGDDPEVDGMELVLTVDGRELDVEWEDNASVDALKALAKDTLSVSLARHSSFEQVGRVGKTLVSDDQSITAGPGDIVLYNSNHICIFFGENRWDYTRLGKITGLSQEELSSILDVPTVTAVFTAEPVA